MLFTRVPKKQDRPILRGGMWFIFSSTWDWSFLAATQALGAIQRADDPPGQEHPVVVAVVPGNPEGVAAVLPSLDKLPQGFDGWSDDSTPHFDSDASSP